MTIMIKDYCLTANDDGEVEIVRDSLNNISESEIEEQGNWNGDIICDNCTYTTGYMQFKEAVFKVNMQGGYFMYDGEGGLISKCPSCEAEGLFIEN